MSFIIGIRMVLLILIIIFPIYIIGKSFKKGSEVKKMLMGIEMTLVGGILVIDSNMDLEEVGYLIMFLGFIVTLVGFNERK
ncbi:hypothetical protein [Dethiothermospora halolimnae]|uniref:hypothetical protein n=1 Tax=Dethiothermospora halolimnae TaxID=3114390 RepID=UPI003CCC201B